jgi:hypothetical protein
MMFFLEQQKQKEKQIMGKLCMDGQQGIGMCVFVASVQLPST